MSGVLGGIENSSAADADDDLNIFDAHFFSDSNSLIEAGAVHGADLSAAEIGAYVIDLILVDADEEFLGDNDSFLTDEVGDISADYLIGV